MTKEDLERENRELKEENASLKAYNEDLIELNQSLDDQLGILAKYVQENEAQKMGMAESMLEKVGNNFMDIFSLGQGKKDTGEA